MKIVKFANSVYPVEQLIISPLTYIYMAYI